MASKRNEGRAAAPADDDDDDDDTPAGPARPGMVARMAKKNDQKADKAKRGMQLRAELDELLRAEKDREAALQGKPAQPSQPYKLYQTLYEYKSEDPEDLNFDAGEILRVFDDEGNWFEGENQQGRRGNFPGTYVRKMNVSNAGGGMKVGGLPSE